MTPEQEQAFLKDVAEHEVKLILDSCREVWENGFLFINRSKPRERLNGYLQATLPADLPLVTNPDYWQARFEGSAPELACVTMLNAYDRAVVTFQGLGMPAPRKPPEFWALIGRLPAEVSGWISSDFAQLRKQYQPEGSAVPVGGMQMAAAESAGTALPSGVAPQQPGTVDRAVQGASEYALQRAIEPGFGAAEKAPA